MVKKTGDNYYVGRFPDMAGKTRWQVVRHSAIKHWDGNKLSGSSKKAGNSFYELVTDPEILSVSAKQSALLHFFDRRVPG